jgi:hypothetical protein
MGAPTSLERPDRSSTSAGTSRTSTRSAKRSCTHEGSFRLALSSTTSARPVATSARLGSPLISTGTTMWAERMRWICTGASSPPDIEKGLRPMPCLARRAMVRAHSSLICGSPSSASRSSAAPSRSPPYQRARPRSARASEVARPLSWRLTSSNSRRARWMRAAAILTSALSGAFEAALWMDSRASSRSADRKLSRARSSHCAAFSLSAPILGATLVSSMQAGRAQERDRARRRGKFRTVSPEKGTTPSR